jgi:UDP-GlcNAc:undecaprenyl-phosphate GlcNAc-1-phosphate transferase
MNPAQAVALISGLCIITCAGALLSWYLDQEWLGIMVVAGVIGLLIATRVFGHVELLLLKPRLLGFGRILSPYSTDKPGDIRHTRLNLQGSRQWDDLWGALVESAERFQLIKLRLNLSLPRLHEDFYGSWHKAGAPRRDLQWQAEIPITVNGQSVGRLSVVGAQKAAAAASGSMSQFLGFVETLESQLALLIEQDMAKLIEAGHPAPALAPLVSEPVLPEAIPIALGKSLVP